MTRIRIFAVAIAAMAVFLPPSHAAARGERTGKEVVETFCIECHGIGANGAPRIGDSKAWAPRAERGLTGLTDSALAGVRRMPPHGGTLQIDDLEIARAITYMVNQSGGRWNEPTDRTTPVATRSGAGIVQSQCVKCHQKGEGGAPRIGDKDAWIRRVRPGLDSLVASVIRGHGGMPARGGLADLTDAEVRTAIVHMFQASVTQPGK